MPRRWFVFVLCAGCTGYLLSQNPPSSPPKADTSGEAVVFERISNRIRFEDDGTGVRDTTAVVRVQSQAGVQAFGQLIFGYSSATEQLEMDYVRVRKPDGKVVPTPAADAQDFAPDILREAPAYSDYRQRHVSVIDLHPGDVLEYHTIVHVTTPLAPREFWYEHNFPQQAAIGEDRLEIDVPKARALKLKSPDHKFEVRETADRRIYTWVVRDVVPDRKRDRSEDEFDHSDDQPDVQVSTFADWQQVAHWYAKLQGERVTVDDAVRQKAAELTRGAATPQEKARRLYDYVAGNVRYVSISFGIGRLQPHAASEVLRNGFGDCKDKHTLLEALLRAQGMASYPVLIPSSRELDPDVPSPAQFDHEITAARLGKDENLTWLDTTAGVAPYGLLLYQLRNKQALVASDDDYSGLRRTPADSPVKDLTVLKLDGKFNETGAFDTLVDFTVRGDNEVPLRLAFQRVLKADWQNLLQVLSRQWGIEGDVSEIHVDSLDDTSKPLHLFYHFHKENYFIVPTSSASFRLLPAVLLPQPAKPNPHKPSQTLRVGPAMESVYRAHIQFPANYSVSTPSTLHMARDYGDYSSSYTVVKNVLEAERHLVLKVNELPAGRRGDYESFRNIAGDDVQQVLTCNITPASAAAVASAANVKGTPEEVRKAGSAALQRRDFKSAADLLKRSLDQDAGQKGAWEELGRAYAALNQHDEAVAAFRKQLDADPYDLRANGDLAAELQQQSKFDEAIAGYRKQIEVVPDDKSAHKNLGLLLAQLNREQEALPELEAAAALPPEDPEIKIALARVYAKTGDAQKAEALMKSVTGASTLPSDPDFFASALRDDLDPNQTQRDARHTLDSIGDQFDSGEFERLGPSAFSAMNLVALAWARIGWAKFLQGETMEAMQFLNSAWTLSQSGVVGNHLARLLEKEGQREKARHMYGLAYAAGGTGAEGSRQGLTKLAATPAAAEQEIVQAGAELHKARTVQLPAIVSGTASATYILVFDSSTRAERADFVEGDPSLASAGPQIQQKAYPVKFPDVSSIKLIRRAKLSCGNSACSLELLPPEPMMSADAAAASTQKR